MKKVGNRLAAPTFDCYLVGFERLFHYILFTIEKVNSLAETDETVRILAYKSAAEVIDIACLGIGKAYSLDGCRVIGDIDCDVASIELNDVIGLYA